MSWAYYCCVSWFGHIFSYPYYFCWCLHLLSQPQPSIRDNFNRNVIFPWCSTIVWIPHSISNFIPYRISLHGSATLYIISSSVCISLLFLMSSKKKKECWLHLSVTTLPFQLIIFILAHGTPWLKSRLCYFVILWNFRTSFFLLASSSDQKFSILWTLFLPCTFTLLLSACFCIVYV